MKLYVTCLLALVSIQIAQAEPIFYYMNATHMTFYQSEKMCQYYGAYLATIESQEVEDEIQSVIANADYLDDNDKFQDFWIGRNDIAIEGRFVNAKGDQTDHYDWCNGSPDNWQDNEDCVIYSAGARCLADVPCDYQYMSLCESEVSYKNRLMASGIAV